MRAGTIRVVVGGAPDQGALVVSKGRGLALDPLAHGLSNLRCDRALVPCGEQVQRLALALVKPQGKSPAIFVAGVSTARVTSRTIPRAYVSAEGQCAADITRLAAFVGDSLQSASAVT